MPGLKSLTPTITFLEFCPISRPGAPGPGDDWGQVRMTHRWRSSEAVDDKLHLSDNLKAKIGKSVVNFFEGELERNGPLV